MTEAEWLACVDPQRMLEQVGSKTSERKLRLFACACCRRVWHLITDERSQRGVELAERFADGLVDEEEMAEADLGAGEAATEQHPHGPPYDERWSPGCASQAVAFATCDRTMFHEMDAQNTAHWTRHALADRRGFDCLDWEQRQRLAEAFNGTGQLVAVLLRDIFGTPFRPVTLAPAWLTPAVVSLARVAYEDRDLPSGHLKAEHLGPLHDALLDAGCTDADILDHLRGPGPHVRGCWPVDLLLGKE